MDKGRVDKQRDGHEVIASVGSFTTSDGVELKIYPLTIGDFAYIRDAALSEYRRDSILVYTENIDLLPPDMRQQFMRDAFEKAQAIHHEDLPAKPVSDEAGNVVLSEAEYSLWWMSSTPVGIMTATWLSVKKGHGQESCTLEYIKERFPLDETGNNDDLDAVGQKIGAVTNPGIAGNGEPPASPGEIKKARKARRERRKKRARK